jgi:hypothetical protein
MAHYRWSKNTDRNRKIYEKKQKTGLSNAELSELFGLHRSVIAYNLREYKKDMEGRNG